MGEERSTDREAVAGSVDAEWEEAADSAVVGGKEAVVTRWKEEAGGGDSSQKNCSSTSDFPGGCVVRIDGALLCHRCLYVVYEGI